MEYVLQEKEPCPVCQRMRSAHDFSHGKCMEVIARVLARHDKERLRRVKANWASKMRKAGYMGRNWDE